MCIAKFIKTNMYFGIDRKRYKNLRKHKDRKTVRRLVEKLGSDTVNRGYIVRVYQLPANRAEFYPGRHMLIEEAEYVSGIFGVEFYGQSGLWNDFACCRKAEEDGIRFINDIPGLEKGRYVDTKTNRDICLACLKSDPNYRIENWLRTYTPFGRIYTDTYGDPAKIIRAE